MKHVKLVHSVDDSGATADTRLQFNSDDAVLNQLLTEYDGLFEGIGEFPGEHSLTLHPAAKPAVHPPRRVPEALRDKIKQELHNRNVGLGVCLDPRDLNAAIKRPYYPVPTPEGVTRELAGARHFSVLCTRRRYWQIKLSYSTSCMIYTIHHSGGIETFICLSV